MRTAKFLSENQTYGWFAGDIPGGCQIECERCQHTQDAISGLPDEKTICENCGTELMYMEWWSW
jgi:ribosomal protein S27E